jgi:uncharacterized protein DUF6069
MTTGPFGPFPEDASGARAGRPPRPWQRAARCRAARRTAEWTAGQSATGERPAAGEPVEQPLERYAGFVALHEALSAEPEVNLVRLWTGGIAAAVVAAVMTVLGSVVARELFGVTVPVPVATTANPAAATVAYALCAMALTIQATVLLHVLVERSQQAVRVFAWIGLPLILVASVLPFAARPVPIERAWATAAINCLTGIVVLGLLASACSLATSRGDPYGAARNDPRRA